MLLLLFLIVIFFFSLIWILINHLQLLLVHKCKTLQQVKQICNLKSKTKEAKQKQRDNKPAKQETNNT